jgi:hypothetical protein
MADAVCAAYEVDYEGLYVRERNAGASDFPDVFVGGATARILEYIFGTPAHSQFIASKRMRFLENQERRALRVWEAGLAFGRNEAFTSHWNRRDINEAIRKTPTTYVATAARAHGRPFNPDQGFYDVLWGRIRPLTPGFGNIADYGPGDPPRERDSEYRRDYLDVLERGAYREELTPEQVRSGLFWAYDGARLIGTPTRLYNTVIRQIAEDDGLSPHEMARLLALSNIAIADASIVCWGAKYHYRVWRPVVAIRQTAEWIPAGVPRTNPMQLPWGATRSFGERRSTSWAQARATACHTGQSRPSLQARRLHPELPGLPLRTCELGGSRLWRPAKGAGRARARRPG